jgi:glucose 1-dehydrogenase
MKALENKVAVVTGGTRGLGLGIAREFIAAGASVVIAGRSQSALDNALAELQSGGGQAGGISCDVGDLKQIEALGTFTVQTFGKIDIWVNNAGLSVPYGPTAAIAPADFMRLINTNIVGVYNGSRVALWYMLPNHSGKLINILGRSGNKGIKFQNAYSASKIWVRSFTLSLAEEYKDQGVGIFAFNPGLVDTDMLRHVDVVQGYEQKVKPLETVIRLWGNQPDLPAKKALWLASNATDGKTGLVVNVINTKTMLGGLFREFIRQVMNKPAPDTSLDIHTVMPDQ